MFVNGEVPPQDVTPANPFTVDVHLTWNLLMNTLVNVEIYDLSFGWPLIVDYFTVVANGEDSGVRSIHIPAVLIPAINGAWKLRAAVIFAPPGGSPFESSPPDYERFFDVNVVGQPGGGGNSDWAVTGTLLSPVDPFLGTDVTFIARIEVTTTDPLPQTVTASYALDGVEQTKGPLTYEDGMAFLAAKSPPWTPTLGDHTVRWEVDPDHQYNDGNPANNVLEQKFTVFETAPCHHHRLQG